MLSRLWAGITDWRTSVPGGLLLLLLVAAHWIGADGMRVLTAEATALGELLQALTGALGFLPGLVGIALLIWNSRKGPTDGRS